MNDHIDFEWLRDMMNQRPDVPAGERDGISIVVDTLPAGKKTTVVSMRNALLRGEPVTDMSFECDHAIRALRDVDHGEWFRDDPQEVWQMYDALEAIADMDDPSVLVGGLGLGTFSRLADVYAGGIVTTVERDERIVELVAKYATRRVIVADIYNFVREIGPDEYDIAFLDTWQMTGEQCWVDEVVPLRRLIGGKIPEIHCWNEREMFGQIGLGIFRAISIPLDNLPKMSIHYRVVRRAAERAGIAPDEPLPSDETKRMFAIMERAEQMVANPVALSMVRRFVNDVGLDDWEAEFGGFWDDETQQRVEWRRASGLTE